MKKKSRLLEELTRINTVLIFILLVVVGLDLIKNLFLETPDLLYPIFYAFLGFSFLMYIQYIFFSYYDNNIAPLLFELRKELQVANLASQKEEEN